MQCPGEDIMSPTHRKTKMRKDAGKRPHHRQETEGSALGHPLSELWVEAGGGQFFSFYTFP